MLAEIPKEFDYEVKHYKGHFVGEDEGGGSIWHLMIDNTYKGN
jgi:hypothetical protein